MEMEKFAKQMIDFQKTTFDNTFSALVKVQDQTEKVFETALAQNVWLPEEGRRLIDEWVSAVKKGRSDFKGIVDENFVKMNELFTVAPAVKPQAPQTAPAAPAAKTK